MLPGKYANLLIAGRMIDADPIAHAGICVMVNMNQTGEAVGVAATPALPGDVRTLETPRLRRTRFDTFLKKQARHSGGRYGPGSVAGARARKSSGRNQKVRRQRNGNIATSNNVISG
ncbi:MAG: FAD-dependent oxidoreductase [Fibrella sp.]|nr:FAD-dependent oxidoreductase [Armatimonadota bacterium]